MSRSIAVLLVALVAVSAASAQALRVLETVERSVELALREVTLPAAGRRAVLYRPCATCPLETHTVTDKTTYLFNDRVLPLAETAIRQSPAPRPACATSRAAPSASSSGAPAMSCSAAAPPANRTTMRSRGMP